MSHYHHQWKCYTGSPHPFHYFIFALYSSHLDGCAAVSHYDFNSSNGVECFCMCLSAICISSPLKCPVMTLAHFLTGVLKIFHVQRFSWCPFYFFSHFIFFKSLFLIYFALQYCIGFAIHWQSDVHFNLSPSRAEKTLCMF